MEDVLIELSGDLAEALRVPPEEQASRLRRELAIRLYEKGLLSFGKARELANLNKWEFHLVLGEEGIARHYDMDELREDMKTLETLD